MPPTRLFNCSVKPMVLSFHYPRPPLSFSQLPRFRFQIRSIILRAQAPEQIREEAIHSPMKMPPKKSASKAKGQQVGDVEPSEQGGWKPSKCYDFQLLGLVEENLLQPREKVHWRKAIGDVPPQEEP